MKREIERREGYFFWKYDTYPYLLGGLGNMLKGSDLAYIPAYQGTFRPVYVFWNLEDGRKFKEELQQLDRDYIMAQNMLQEGAQKQLARFLEGVEQCRINA